MAASTSKKVWILRFDREPVHGFVNPQTYLQTAGIELLSAGGSFSTVPYEEIKTVQFVKEFEPAEATRGTRVFSTRPKMEGLWVDLRFRDGDHMEGILGNNLLQLSPHGFSIVPPESGNQNQRVFVPRAALEGVQVLGVVGSPLRSRKAKPSAKEQIELFEGRPAI